MTETLNDILALNRNKFPSRSHLELLLYLNLEHTNPNSKKGRLWNDLELVSRKPRKLFGPVKA